MVVAAGSASDNRIDKSESAVGSVVRRNSSQLQEEEEEEDPRKRGKRPGRARLECHLIQKAVAVGNNQDDSCRSFVVVSYY